MTTDFFSFLLAVLEHLHGWISGSVLALAVELLDRLWGWKIPRRPWIAIFIVGGLIVSCFEAWREEHDKVRAQQAYISIKTGESWIPHAAPWLPGHQVFFDFGKENATSYPAIQESSIQELVIRKATHPIVSLITPDNDPTTDELETSAWEEMLRDRQNGNHPTSTFDPGEKGYSAAFSKGPLSEDQLERIIIFKTDMVYLVGLEKWKTGDGVHGKSFCFWMHPPDQHSITLDKCSTHNDYIEDMEPYVKYFK